MWTILKVFIEFVTVLFLFYVLVFFGHEACGILAPWPGIEPVPPALESEVWTTGPPGKSLALSTLLCFSHPLCPPLSGGSQSLSQRFTEALVFSRLAWENVCVLSHVQLFATTWTVAHQAPLSMGFSRQEYWSRLPLPIPGDLNQPRDQTCISFISRIGRQIF